MRCLLSAACALSLSASLALAEMPPMPHQPSGAPPAIQHHEPNRDSPGTGVGPGSHFTPTLAAGATVTAATLRYVGSKVASLSVATNGTCTAGNYTVYGTTGTVQNVGVGHAGFWTASIRVDGSGNVAINSLTSGGQYAVNPTSPDTAAGAAGCSVQPTFNVTMGAAYAQPVVQSGGVYTGLARLTQNHHRPRHRRGLHRDLRPDRRLRPAAKPGSRARSTRGRLGRLVRRIRRSCVRNDRRREHGLRLEFACSPYDRPLQQRLRHRLRVGRDNRLEQ